MHIIQLRRELYYCSHPDDAATTELLKSHILEDESLLDYDILVRNLCVVFLSLCSYYVFDVIFVFLFSYRRRES